MNEQRSNEILSFRHDMLLYPPSHINCRYLYKHVQDQKLTLPEWMETEPPRATPIRIAVGSSWQQSRALFLKTRILVG